MRINSYTLYILGDVIKLLNNYYLFNDLSEEYYHDQDELNKEILIECVKLLSDFESNAKKYYKMKFDLVELDDTKICRMISEYEMKLGK